MEILNWIRVMAFGGGLYMLLCVFIPCIIYQIVVVRRSAGSNRIRFSHWVWSAIFIFYLYMAVDVAGIGSVWDIESLSFFLSTAEVNLIPFDSFGTTAYFLNIVMFMPLGFLLPLIWKGYRKWYWTALAGTGFSLLIEAAQLFNFRQTDIDDLMTNTFGAVIGFLIWVIFSKIIKKNRADACGKRRGEAAAYILLAVLGVFFLYNWRWCM